MARILVTTDYLGPGDEIDDLLRCHGHEVTYSPAGGPRDREHALTLFDGIDGAIIASEPVTADMLESATALKVLARSGVGYESIDLAAAARRGVRVCNTPGVNHDAVAEMTIALILMVARTLPAVLGGVRDGRWPRDAGRELRGATLGVIGYGPSGRAVAHLARAFGMSVSVYTRHPNPDQDGIDFADLDTVTAAADYLTLHTRPDDSTHHLIDRKRLQSMKPTAILINTARGNLVDEAALVDALNAGEIAGAALDVLAHEPLPATSELREFDNVLITSHLAGQTAEARIRAAMSAAHAVIDVLAGREPVHPVDQEMVGP
ncbi:phosphoglycerate dehydrogenase [Rhodococcus koreensis]